MKNEVKNQRPFDIVLLCGLLLSVACNMINKYIIEVPDIIAIPLMIVCIILMVVGILRSGKVIGNKKK